MKAAERICVEAHRLPEPLAREFLDFIGYLKARHRLSDQPVEELKNAQEPVMYRLWDNSEDEVWNDLKTG
jgi:hypothetical protein